MTPPEPAKGGCKATEQSRDEGSTLKPEVGEEIARHLRQLYGQHLSEPLPDKFTSLLAKLSKADTQK